MGASAQLSQAHLHTDKAQSDPMVSPKATFKPIFKNVPVLEEDFQTGVPGLPAGWETNDVEQLDASGNPLGTFVPGFVTGDADAANNGGFLPIPDIAGNTFAYANDDGPPCDCDMIDVYLQTPMMDFTDVTNAAVTFNGYQDGNYGSGDWTVLVSTDGTTWTEEFLSTAADDASPEWREIVVTLFDYDGESQVWIRFQWSDAGSWASGFAIDNVVVDAILENNLSLQEVFSADPNNPDLENVVIEYTQVPLEQAVPMWVGGAVTNNGIQTQTNVVVNAELFLNGTSQGTFTSDPIASLDFGQTDSIFIETGWTPDDLGEVEVAISTASDQVDEDPSNNADSESFMITEDIYARDQNSAALFQSNGDLEFRSANLYEMPVAGTVIYGVAVAFGAGLTNPTQPGTITEVELLNGDFEFLVGAEYEVQAGDISETGEANFGYIPFEDTYEVSAGELVLGSVHHFGGTSDENVRVALSGQSIPQTSFFQDELGEWFYTTNTPMIRLVTSEITSLEDLDFESGIKLLQNYPNPFANNTVIEYQLQQADDVLMQVIDMDGKIVHSEDLGTKNAGPNKWFFNLDGIASGIYTYSLTTSNATITKKMVVNK
ncbi:MAG: T9SS type A sorting domain-containing protein [Flavobacteriales bacterium]|nr:T9SS type A sorting domain-containing protein [Flavobacteriales bacterium]